MAVTLISRLFAFFFLTHFYVQKINIPIYIPLLEHLLKTTLIISNPKSGALWNSSTGVPPGHAFPFFIFFSGFFISSVAISFISSCKFIFVFDFQQRIFFSCVRQVFSSLSLFHQSFCY